MKKVKSTYRKGLLYHRLRFGLLGNIKALFCRVFGHELNNNCAHPWCERCHLAYEEIYHKQGDYYAIVRGDQKQSNQ